MQVFIVAALVTVSFLFSVFAVTFSFNQASEVKQTGKAIVPPAPLIAKQAGPRDAPAAAEEISDIINEASLKGAPDALTTSLIELPIKPNVPSSIGTGNIEKEEALKDILPPATPTIEKVTAPPKPAGSIFSDIMEMVKKTVKTEPKNNIIQPIAKKEEKPAQAGDEPISEDIPENETVLPKEVLAANNAIKNYNTQILPSEIYKREYDERNTHLPKAVYREDLQKHFLTATERGNIIGMRAFLDKGTNPNDRIKNGDTYLIHSIIAGQNKATRLLLARGANPNAKGEWGQTALHIAAFAGDKNMARLLLEMNADPRIKNDAGATPYKLAQEQGNIEVANLIIHKNQELFRASLEREEDRVRSERENSRLANQRLLEKKRLLVEIERMKREREELKRREEIEAPIREAARIEAERVAAEATEAEEIRQAEEKRAAEVAAAEAKIEQQKREAIAAQEKAAELEKSIIEARKAKRKRSRFQLVIPPTILPDWKEATLPEELKNRNDSALPEELLQAQP